MSVMLRKFSVSNYKNFKNEVVIDFTNTHDYGFNKGCIDDKLLSKVLLVGKNASGKTNLAYALFDIVYTLTDNLCHPLQKDFGSFINGEGRSKEAKFFYEFQNDDHALRYTYAKTLPDQMTCESLYVDDERIFEFNYRTRKFDTKGLKNINAGDSNFVDKLDGSISALRVIANNTIQDEKSPIRFIMDFVSRMLYFRSCQDGNAFIGMFNGVSDIEQHIIKNGLVGDFQKFINEMTGLGIRLDVFKGPVSSGIVQKFPNKQLYFRPIASSGTMALELYYYWSKSFNKVSFLYIDEFDAYYHFELSAKILQYTIDNVSAQTIFTSHNTMLVSNDYMRPDCCLKIENGRIVSFADSTTRELREGHNIEKMLRNGAFDE